MTWIVAHLSRYSTVQEDQNIGVARLFQHEARWIARQKAGARDAAPGLRPDLTRRTVSVHFLITDLTAGFPGREKGQALSREAVRHRCRLELRLVPDDRFCGRGAMLSPTMSDRSIRR